MFRNKFCTRHVVFTARKINIVNCSTPHQVFLSLTFLKRLLPHLTIPSWSVRLWARRQDIAYRRVDIISFLSPHLTSLLHPERSFSQQLDYVLWQQQQRNGTVVPQIRLGHGEDCHRSHGTPWASQSSAAGAVLGDWSGWLYSCVVGTAAPLFDLRGSAAQSYVWWSLKLVTPFGEHFGALMSTTWGSPAVFPGQMLL